MDKPQVARLEDVISYVPESEFSEDEVSLIRNVFNGPTGFKLLKVIRKVMLPTMTDPELPMEKLGADAFFAGVDFRSMQADEIKSIVMGRQEAIKFVIGGLVQLRNIANIKEETEAERQLRLKKNSTK